MRKFITITIVIALITTTFASAASAKEITNNDREIDEEQIQLDPEEQKIVDEMADQLEFLYTEASESDENANLTAININKLKQKYGDDGSLQKLRETINEQQKYSTEQPVVPTFSYNNFGKCIVKSVGSVIGLDVVKRAMNGKVRKALKSHAWKKASAIFYNNIKKYLGKRATKYLIKKIAHIGLPGGLPAKFAFVVAKCGIKEIV
jgi:hypothetical protein